MAKDFTAANNVPTVRRNAIAQTVHPHRAAIEEGAQPWHIGLCTYGRQRATGGCTAAFQPALTQLRHRMDQQIGIGMEWCFSVRLSSPGLNLVAAVHHHNVVAQGSHGGDVMADEQIGHPKFLSQVAQQFENRCTDHCIQCRGHLVAENQIRLGRQGPGQIDPLLLPAGQFVRTTFSQRARQTNEIQQLTDTLAQSRPLEAEIHLQRATQNSADAVHRVECGVGILKDHLNASELLVGARR
ncbi:hypothetical protein D9M71_439660 [compost metagenome]